MCVVSMVMDHYCDKWRDRSPWKVPDKAPPMIPTWPQIPAEKKTPPITPEEIEEFRKLLERAREYDRRNGEPDCELEEKRDKIKKLADEVGVKIDFL